MFDRCVYFNLVTLTRQITKIWQAEFERLGLGPSHGYLLFAIVESPGASQKDLGDVMELDASNITRMIEKLAHKGLVTKTSHGKGAAFTVTEDGRAAYRRVSAVMDALYADMQARFGAEAFDHFVGDLRQAKDSLHKHGKEDSR